MPYLKPNIVGKAARMLFGTGHSEALVFFFLKAEGASTDTWITITSSNTPPKGLRLLAEQPPGFDDLVKDNADSFQAGKATTNIEGVPTKPGARGSLDGYTMFFPITEEAQYILRKSDCNRNAVYSNITMGRGEINKDRKTSRDEIFELRDSQSGSAGKELRLKNGYAFAAYWYYGPRPDTPMRVPLRPLAIWLHRYTEVPDDISIDSLVSNTIEMLNITVEELHLIFDLDVEFPLAKDDLTGDFDLKAYFRALCLPNATVQISRPVISPKHFSMDRETWEFQAEAFGLRRRNNMQSPNVVSKALLDGGERSLLLFGPPRTGKSYLAASIAADYLGVNRGSVLSDSRVTRVQFHQGWTYGDFMRKVLPTPTASGGLSFSRANGKFLQHCIDHRDAKSVFIIEEINRAPLASVFGEAFQVIEAGYRDTAIELPGSIPGDDVTDLVVSKNLLLIATANDLDKSTLPLDFAFLGRFSVVDCPVMYDQAFEAIVKTKGWSRDLAEKFLLLLREVESISGYPVGHAFFYDFCSPSGIGIWYRATLRPSLTLFLTKYRAEDLERLDMLFHDWESS